MASIKDVARHAGVSNGTISRYFHEPNRVRQDTRERIHAAIEELGYLPNTLARNFRLGKTRLILTLMEAVGDPFYGDVMAGITYVAKQRGYKIHIEEYERGSLSRSDLRDIVQSRQADGIIVLGGTAAFRQAQEGESVTGTPPIIVCGETSDPALIAYPRVQIDGFAASRELTNYLIGLGHRNIAFMGGEAESILLLDREGGYRTAMTEAGLAIRDDWIVYGQLNVAKSRQATRELVNAGVQPTAIVCANDEMALGTIAELYSMKIRVPEDISVVGFDNTRYAETSIPPLTTIAQPSHSIGETTMYRLLQAIKNPELETGVTYLQHRLIVRESARAPFKSDG
jgi:LacI family repressor for deo operon, udp, cdd, tsx, nupC, and nupG